MREREFKLEIEPASLPRVQKWLQKRGATAKPARNLTTVYFDTPDFALRRAGITLRIRKSGERLTQTIKRFGTRAAGVFDRPEWESSVDGFVPDLRAARKTGLKLFRGNHLAACLQPVFEAKTRRADFSSADGLAISIDRGQVIAGRRRARFCEIEFEWGGNSLDDAFETARALSRIAAVRVGVMAKSDRGYALLGQPDSTVYRAREPQLESDMTAAEAFHAIGRECLHHLAANVPGTILGTVESLHQLRVGLRRLRAAMSLFADILDEDQANRMKRELQWVNRCVGPARDLDVLLGTGSAAAIRTRLTAQRRRAYAAAARALRSRRFNNLVLDLANWIESAHKMHAKRPVVVHATAELTRRHKKLVRQLADLPVLDPAQRHDLRIRAKRLRYGIEFFGPVFGGGKNARRRHHLLSALKHLQDELGILNDIATQQQLIGRFSPAAAATPVAEADAPQHLDAAIAAARKVAKAKPFWT